MKIPPEPVRHAIKAQLAVARYRVLGARCDHRIEDLRPFIVTGPPRSGTSLTTALLHRLPNTVVINEPDRLAPHRLGTIDPVAQLRSFIVDTANRAIRRGHVINKTEDDTPDRLSTDTFHAGSAWRPVPVDLRPDLPAAIGAKRTLPFLEHLRTFCEGWPELRAIVIIRDPLRTLRSQRHTFGWQRALDDPTSRQYHYAAFDAVDLQADPVTKRAQFWAALVRGAVEAAEQWPNQVRLVRYAALVESPMAMLEAMGTFIGTAPPRVEPSDFEDVRPRNRTGVYDEFSSDEVESIRHHTAEALAMAESVARATEPATARGG